MKHEMFSNSANFFRHITELKLVLTNGNIKNRNILKLQTELKLEINSNYCTKTQLYSNYYTETLKNLISWQSSTTLSKNNALSPFYWGLSHAGLRKTRAPLATSRHKLP